MGLTTKMQRVGKETEMKASPTTCDSPRQSTLSSPLKTRLVFPDAMEQRHQSADDDDDNCDEDAIISSIFFEFANVDEVAYRVRNQIRGDDLLIFRQDMSACERHTGGIIWETSYLLLEYLLELSAVTNKSLGKTLELGAGVGFLGQCLAAARCCKPVVLLTETADVLVNLRANMELNRLTLERNNACSVVACALDWTSYRKDAESSEGAIQPHTFDTLLGTDVIFATHLVEPLLESAAFLSHSGTVWYLCVQIRCAAAHKLFLEKAREYDFEVEDASGEAFTSKRCAWGKALDCLLYRITRAPKVTKNSIRHGSLNGPDAQNF